MCKKGKRKWLRNALWVAFGILALPLLLVGFIRWRTHAAWENFRSDWEARGEQFGISHHLPEPVPDSVNLAMHRPFLGTWIPDNQSSRDWFDGLDPASAAGWTKSALTPKPHLCRPADLSLWEGLPEELTAEERLDEIRSRLAPITVPLDTVAAALEARPHCHFPIEYALGLLLPTPHVFVGLKIAAGFNARALVSLEALESEQAVRDLLAMRKLARSYGSGEFLIPLLVDLAIQRVLIGTLWNGLASQAFSESQLLTLAAAFEVNSGYAERTITAIRMERDFLLSFLDSLEGQTTISDADLAKAAELHQKVPRLLTGIVLDSSRLGIAEVIQDTILAPGGTMQSRVTVEAARTFEETRDQRWTGWKKYQELYAAVGVPRFDSAIYRALETEALLTNARIAIALERHRLAHGSYPRELSALVPEFLPEIPTDHTNDRPIEYRLKPDGTPLLYQWGCDGDDDSGTPRKSPRAGDVVWQYTLDKPLTEQEWRQED